MVKGGKFCVMCISPQSNIFKEGGEYTGTGRIHAYPGTGLRSWDTAFMVTSLTREI